MRPGRPWKLAVALLGLLVLAAPGLQAGPRAQARRLVRALSARAFKVRLQAAIQLGKRKLEAGLPALRKAADSGTEHPAVRAAALVSLGQLGDQPSRKRCAYLIAHKNELIAKAADRALRLLDQALPQRPYYLVAIEPPKLPKKMPAEVAKLVMQALRRRVAHTGGLVPGAGEQRFLSDQQLAAHLARRDLIGLQLKPELVQLTAEVDGGRTTVQAQLRLVQFRLPGKQREFSAEGGADAWIEDTRISAVERRELQAEVIAKASDSALMQLLEDLQSRAE